MTISVLKVQEVVQLLEDMSLCIDQWGRVKDKTKGKQLCSQYNPSREALELYCFAFHVAGWIRNDEWKLMLFDNSSLLSLDEKVVFSQFSSKEFENIFCVENPALLVDLNVGSRSRSEIKVAYLIYFTLLFEAHCWIVSSACRHGQHLGIQDGFVYFISKDNEHIDSAQDLISNYETNKRKMPDWTIKSKGSAT
ncbi:MAG: hypothetical protein MI867_04920 [Pseudomonadales bacterium]|nr:hypothetical protein [Pseudomonadales bacterium]